VIILAALSVVLSVIYFILVYLSASLDNGEALLDISIICVTLALVIGIGLSIYNFTRKTKKFISLDDIITEEINKYFQNLNKKFYGNLEFRYNGIEKEIECLILKSIEKSPEYNSNVYPNKLCLNTNIQQTHLRKSEENKNIELSYIGTDKKDL
jgi:hypothetical protein